MSPVSSEKRPIGTKFCINAPFDTHHTLCPNGRVKGRARSAGGVSRNFKIRAVIWDKLSVRGLIEPLVEEPVGRRRGDDPERATRGHAAACRSSQGAHFPKARRAGQQAQMG